MPLDRRRFLTLAAAGVASGLAAPGFAAPASPRPRIRAVAFDGFTTFDPRPVLAVAEELFPGHGLDLSNAWRTRQSSTRGSEP